MLHSGKRLVAYILNQTVSVALNAAALGSALYIFTQLLPEENLVAPLTEYVYASPPLMESADKDTALFKARRWEDCKGVYKLVLSRTACRHEWTQTRLAAEAAMIEAAKGVPHVVQFEATTTEVDVPAGPAPTFFLLLERLQGGSSLDKTLQQDTVEQMKTSERIEMARQVVRQLLEALAGLHERGIAHGGLDTTSLYVVGSKTETGRTFGATLTDVAVASRFQQGERVVTDTFLDLESKQLEYVAPEVLVRAQKGADTGYPVAPDKVDVWSAGVILLLVASRQLPFESSVDGDGARELMRQHQAWDTALHSKRSRHPLLKLLDSAPPSLASLAIHMLQIDPVRRISARAALQHSFFQ